MRERSRSDHKKLAILGALGLGLAIASRKRRWHRYAFSQMQAGGGQLPPMIDAKLRAWHEQEHAKAKSGGAAPEGGRPQQV